MEPRHVLGSAQTAIPAPHMAPSPTSGWHFCCRHLLPEAHSELVAHAPPMAVLAAQTPHDEPSGTLQWNVWHWAPSLHACPSACVPGLNLQMSGTTPALKSSHDCASTASEQATKDSGVLPMSCRPKAAVHHRTSRALHVAKSPQND